ncbi:protein-disulfide reductase DsbD family protein [Sediminicola luteus]|uniref:Cytochrome C biogenesis protein transmembrane domain-containing protein n=1 Tax=Sediminicola luteus TaxID=319238 RepID=A0A2A4G8H3_9FLAO|nr:thioredoxin family protein [Sediminicola luteus]PCE64055.1 hypothetical protein B7P33_12495 [Sediminicola luteus]
MKKQLCSLLVFLSFLGLQAQFNENPVSWRHEVKALSEDSFEIKMIADLEPEWHLYSQHTAEGGSLPIEFTYVNVGTDYETVGPTEESATEKAYNEVFEVEETFFSGQAIFTQKIKRLDPKVRQLSVELFYQVCKEVCIPGDAVLTISLDGGKAIVEEKNIDDRSKAMAAALKLDIKNKEILNSGDGESVKTATGPWTIFGLGFLGGLIALLTPCVFPMIPLTVSFFTKGAQNRSKGISRAFLYGFFIVLIYALLSLPFHLFDSVDSQILNSIATNIWLNLFFFLIFVVFAFSFFGYFELTLPSSWANKMDSASSKVGGILGIFFMAVTLAIVSFSCTGPILGGLLGSTALAEGDVANNLSIGMIGFGAALALPFALFAMFPAWLNSLPKSGGWMTTVKVVLGFLELALALKFLSNADLVAHWGLLKRELFIGLWILIGILMTAYLFGWIRFPHDGPKKKIRGIRLFTALASLAFTIYLGLGLAKVVDLKLLSGFPPPDFYSVVETESDCPLGLDCYKDYQSGWAKAKASGKPIMFDFTGWACVNCRKMEENVWSDPEVYELLKNEYVLISLYVDDRKALPPSEQFEFKFDSGKVKSIKTIGDKWGTFQTANFGSISQPYYVLMDTEGQLLAPAIQYTDKDTYLAWLKAGLKNHN